MLRTRQLSYTYPGGERLTFPDLTCAAGETLLLLGKSGSGKTTLLQLLAGLRRPTTGGVVLRDTTLQSLSGTALDRFRGRHIGMIFQTAHFVRSVTVRENLRLAQSLPGLPADDARIDALLTSLDVAEKSSTLPGRLSVGQQQRVAIARAVLNRPSVILADEPTSALDDENAYAVLDLLRSRATEVGAALVIVTHDTRLTQRVAQQITL